MAALDAVVEHHEEVRGAIPWVAACVVTAVAGRADAGISGDALAHVTLRRRIAETRIHREGHLDQRPVARREVARHEHLEPVGALDPVRVGRCAIARTPTEFDFVVHADVERAADRIGVLVAERGFVARGIDRRHREMPVHVRRQHDCGVDLSERNVFGVLVVARGRASVNLVGGHFDARLGRGPVQLNRGVRPEARQDRQRRHLRRPGEALVAVHVDRAHEIEVNRIGRRGCSGVDEVLRGRIADTVPLARLVRHEGHGRAAVDVVVVDGFQIAAGVECHGVPLELDIRTGLVEPDVVHLGGIRHVCGGRRRCGQQTGEGEGEGKSAHGPPGGISQEYGTTDYVEVSTMSNDSGPGRFG